MRLSRGISESIKRALFIAFLAGALWLVLQFYTEEELVSAARRFWSWWSTLLSGELAAYWNPVGAAIVLAVVVMFVINPILRLFRSRHRGTGSSYDDHYSDFGGDGGDSD